MLSVNDMCSQMDTRCQDSFDNYLVEHYPGHPDNMRMSFQIPYSMVRFGNDGAPQNLQEILSGQVITEVSRLIWDDRNHDQDNLLFGRLDLIAHDKQPIFSLCALESATHLFISHQNDDGEYTRYFERHRVPRVDDLMAARADWHSCIDDLASLREIQIAIDTKRRNYYVFALGVRKLVGSICGRTIVSAQTSEDISKTRQTIIEMVENAMRQPVEPSFA